MVAPRFHTLGASNGTFELDLTDALQFRFDNSIIPVLLNLLLNILLTYIERYI